MAIDCCTPQKQMLVSACTPQMPVYRPSEWITTHESQGNAIQQVPCPPKHSKKFAKLTIVDTNSSTAEHWQYAVTIGDQTHSISVCNPKQQKSPLTGDEVAQFWVNSFLADPYLLSAGVYTKLISSVATATGYTVVLEIAARDCSITVEQIEIPANTTSTIDAVTVGGGSKLKPGMFVSYDLAAGLSVKPYDAASPYAGFYELPAQVRESPNMAMRTYGGDIANSGTSRKVGGCSDCSSCCGSGCCTIRRTGTALVKLSKPIAAADLVGQPILIQDANGGLTVAAGGTTPPAGSVVIPVPYTFLLNPSSVGSTVVQVTLH
jgi:hypothetical protein